jgi:hypothetical protein
MDTNAPKKIENPDFYVQKLNYVHENPVLPPRPVQAPVPRWCCRGDRCKCTEPDPHSAQQGLERVQVVALHDEVAIVGGTRRSVPASAPAGVAALPGGA